jgi:hypothetical protein
MRIEKSFIEDIKSIVQSQRNKAYAAVNFYMVETYWRIGERIVIEEQKGKERAEFGAFLMRELSKRIEKELGSGFSEVSLRNYRQFYLTFSDNTIRSAVRSELQETDKQVIEKSYAVRSLSELISSSICEKN